MTAEDKHPIAVRFRNAVERLESFIVRRERIILWSSIAVFIITFTSLAAWKLSVFGYNALDLAIYRQVAANSIHGDWFGLSIHPHSYLGDHLELFFAVLWPFYAIWQHPLTLLFLQNVALALAAWPLAKIAARIIGKPWHLIIAIGYLINPMVQNIAMFEFHILPFAIPIVCGLIWAYLERRYGFFVLLALLAMTVREDVALVIVGFGLLAIADRRPMRWSVVLIILGAAWFLVALKVSGMFSGYDQYKYLVYYGWLGNSVGAIIQTIITKPWVVVQHLVQWPSIGLAMTLLVPFAFLPLLRGRWLIPIIPVTAQIFLVQNPADVVAQTHYPSLLIPFLTVATAKVLYAIREKHSGRLIQAMSKEWATVSVLYVAVVVYGWLSIGPLVHSVPVMAEAKKSSDRIRLERVMVKKLPAGGTVASLESLTELSDRPRLYSWHYVFLGHKQFSEQTYTLPEDAATGILDQKDFLFYQVLYKKPADAEGYSRIRTTLETRNFNVTAAIDRFILVTRQPGTNLDWSSLFTEGLPVNLQGLASQHQDIEYLGWSTETGSLAAKSEEVNGETFSILPLGLTFRKNRISEKVYQLEFSFIQNKKVVYRSLMPFGGGLFPTSDWSVGSAVTTNYKLLLPDRLRGVTEIQIRVLDLDGRNALNGARSASLYYTKYQPVGSTITLGKIEL